MITLSDVTLVCISSIRIEECLSAINKCTNYCNFYDAKFITDKLIKETSDLKVEKCEPLTSLQQYSDFILTKLHNYVDSSHCLLIQDHAFISNPNVWTNEFLKYDYIGSPWPLYIINQLMLNLRIGFDLHGQPLNCNLNLDNYNPHNYRVGNGAFSLRSKKLLKAISTFENKYPDKPEDNIICIYEKNTLESNSFKIAPIDVAAAFSVEMPTEYNPHADNSITFGFHGR
jgi:hypothetical protein